MIVGDFNIHIDDVSDKFAIVFINITESFNLIQYVTGPTHIRGHTLDLVFSCGLNIGSVLSEDIFISDHNCISFDLFCNVDSPSCSRVINSRILNYLSAEKFSAVFDNSSIRMSNGSVDAQVQSFNEHCLLVLDEVAPVKSRAALLINSTPWINDSICSFKHICHKTECLWKST